MIVGYARTSTLDQKAGLAAQEAELRALGCERVFIEQASSVKQRDILEEAIEFVRRDDVFVVTKLDRLARSVVHLWEIVERLKAKGVTIRIVGLGIDTATSNGALMLNVLGAVAQWEREMMLERQRIGIAAAKEAGSYKGRVPTARRQSAEIMRLKGEGQTVPQIMKALNVSRASVYRVIQEQTADV
ncbi:recombinase family protein [Methylorubrum thiocyanatum]|uniref:recombinase family protein n=1 Tax=Methylorubrum thiocyanatum TaxID=47958 RepID=UPI00383B67A4